MASRNTLQEAQEVKAGMESRHPGIEIRIVDTGTRFNIMEVRKCADCGSEILTAAIGQLTSNKCRTCCEKKRVKQEKKLQANIKREAERLAWADNFDEMWG